MDTDDRQRHGDRGAQGAVRLLLLRVDELGFLAAAGSDSPSTSRADVAGLTRCQVGHQPGEDPARLGRGRTRPPGWTRWTSSTTRRLRRTLALSGPGGAELRAERRRPPTRPRPPRTLRGHRHRERRLAGHRADRRRHRQGQRPRRGDHRGAEPRRAGQLRGGARALGPHSEALEQSDHPPALPQASPDPPGHRAPARQKGSAPPPLAVPPTALAARRLVACRTVVLSRLQQLRRHRGRAAGRDRGSTSADVLTVNTSPEQADRVRTDEDPDAAGLVPAASRPTGS